MLKQIEKLYREAALKEFPINKKHFGSVAEAFPRTIFEKAFAEGFLKAREMAVKEAKINADLLDKIKYELYASIYTLEDDEFERVFSVRDHLETDFDKLGEEEV